MEYYILLSAIGGVLAVDDRAGWQSLLAQPVFAGLLVGVLLGQPKAGIAVGLPLEFVWLSILPMRGIRRPDHIAGAIVGAGTACLLIRYSGVLRFDFLTTIGVFNGLLAGIIGMGLAKPMFDFKEKRLSRFAVPRESIGFRELGRLHLASSAAIFAIEFVVILVLLVISVSIGRWVSLSLLDSIHEGARFWSVLIPVFGIASLIQIYWHRFSVRFLFLSMMIVLLVLWIH
jgi:mannose/fructose/N-acetylgalactosamine-specific phosphotransferase system component IIC